MRSIFKYYVLILTPLLLLLGSMSRINNYWFVILLFVYAFLFRPFIDGNRLIQKGKLKPSEFYKLLNPLYPVRYFKDLYLN
jgi:hypothetical protein